MLAYNTQTHAPRAAFLRVSLPVLYDCLFDGLIHATGSSALTHAQQFQLSSLRQATFPALPFRPKTITQSMHTSLEVLPTSFRILTVLNGRRADNKKLARAFLQSKNQKALPCIVAGHRDREARLKAQTCRQPKPGRSRAEASTFHLRDLLY